MARLFIIGNGYDIARRGGDTKYVEFKKWVYKHYLNEQFGEIVFINQEGKINFRSCRNLSCIPSGVYDGVFVDCNGKQQLKKNDRLLKRLTAALLFYSMAKIEDTEWNNFEENLAKIPLKNIIKNFRDENLNDNVHLERSLGSPVDKEVDLMTSLAPWIHELFAEWIESIGNRRGDIKKAGFDKKVIGHIRQDDTFIIFNYTETVENLFGLKCPYIFYHIHGIYTDVNSIVVGHNNKELKNPNDTFCDEKDYIKQFFSDDYKNPEKVINDYKCLWDRISDAEHLNIYEYGWSCSKVDEDYIKHIVGLREGKATSIHLNDHGDKGLEKAEPWIKYGFDVNHIYLYKEEGDKINEKSLEEAKKDRNQN